jgi:hypothetical protein
LFEDAALAIVFWGSRGKEFFDVKFENGRLVSPNREFALLVSEGRYAMIDPEDFDALVFHGPALNYTSFMASVQKLRSDPRSFSSEFLRDGIKSHLDGKPTNALIRQVRASYKGRIMVSPQPLISEESDFFDGQTISSGERAEIDSILRQYFDQIDAEYLAQPQATVVENKYTAARYSTGSVALVGELNVKHPPNERLHMNGLYGAEVLRAIAGKLNSR